MSPPVADAPRPAEAWGLYDASGELRDINMSKDDLTDGWEDHGVPGHPEPQTAGWSIRRVRVTPVMEDSE